MAEAFWKSVLAASAAARSVASSSVLNIYMARASSITPKAMVRNSSSTMPNSTANTPDCGRRLVCWNITDLPSEVGVSDVCSHWYGELGKAGKEEVLHLRLDVHPDDRRRIDTRADSVVAGHGDPWRIGPRRQFRDLRSHDIVGDGGDGRRER